MQIIEGKLIFDFYCNAKTHKLFWMLKEGQPQGIAPTNHDLSGQPPYAPVVALLNKNDKHKIGKTK